MISFKTTIKENVISIEFTLDAPISLVWQVWTQPDHIKHWYGPEGFTNTIFKMDVEPGGEWEFMMHGPDGKDYKNHNVFQEIIQNEKIVFEHVNAPHFITTVLFTDLADKTGVHWSVALDSAEALEQVIKAVNAKKGLEDNAVKLDRYLSNL